MRRRRSHTSCFILACLVASTLYISQPTYAQDTNVFKTYYVTGDFASAGAGIRGRGVLDPATGKRLASATLTIPPGPKTAKDPGGFAAAAVSSCIPTDANGHYNVDILGAFVYWASIEKTGEQSGAVGYVANYL